MQIGLSEVVFGHGHVNVQATHKTTLEFTKDGHLSKMGDCIIVVGTARAVADLNSAFKKSLANDNARLTILIEAGNFSETVNALGSSRLILTHERDMVIRKSSYVCSRTLAIGADKAAKDISQRLLEKLKDPAQKVKITLTIDY